MACSARYCHAPQYLAFYYLSLAYVAVFVGLFAWALVSFLRNSWPILWPLRVLRALGGLSATTLFIPLFHLLLSGFDCGGKVSNANRIDSCNGNGSYLFCPSQEIASPLWAAAGYTCYSGGHIAQVAIAAILIVTFVCLAFLFTFLIYDSNPLSVDPTAKAHARTDVVFLACKVRSTRDCLLRGTKVQAVLLQIILVVLVEVWPHSLPSSALAGIVFASGVVWVGVFLTLMPYYHHYMCGGGRRDPWHTPLLRAPHRPLQKPTAARPELHVHVGRTLFARGAGASSRSM